MDPFGPEVVTSVQVTGPLNDPVKITPLGIPPVPLPVIVNVPPAANVPPVVRLPEVRAPVEKLRLPNPPVMSPPPPRPSTTVSSEPVRVKPAELPVSVPPVFV